jgi:hypothetical protein
LFCSITNYTKKAGLWTRLFAFLRRKGTASS